MFKNGWLYFIWLLIYLMGFFKLINYYRDQGNLVILLFNNQLLEYCNLYNVILFDIFNMIMGVYSFDGMYFGVGVNIMKV